MANANQPNKVPNQNNSAQTPNKDQNFGGGQQKEQVRPGQQNNADKGIKSPNQK